MGMFVESTYRSMHTQNKTEYKTFANEVYPRLLKTLDTARFFNYEADHESWANMKTNV